MKDESVLIPLADNVICNDCPSAPVSLIPIMKGYNANSKHHTMASILARVESLAFDLSSEVIALNERAKTYMDSITEEVNVVGVSRTCAAVTEKECIVCWKAFDCQSNLRRHQGARMRHIWSATGNFYYDN